MKPLTFPVALAVAMLSACDSTPKDADGLTGFNNFPWGTTRQQLNAARIYPPDADINGPFMAFVTWDAKGETVADLPIAQVTYFFRELCDEPATPCYMWSGSYEMENPSQFLHDKILTQLEAEYGSDFKVASSQEAPILYEGVDEEAPLMTETSHRWSLADKSEVKLIIRELDKGYTDVVDKTFQAGVIEVSIIYTSAEKIAFLADVDRLYKEDNKL